LNKLAKLRATPVENKPGRVYKIRRIIPVDGSFEDTIHGQGSDNEFATLEEAKRYAVKKWGRVSLAEGSRLEVYRFDKGKGNFAMDALWRYAAGEGMPCRRWRRLAMGWDATDNSIRWVAPRAKTPHEWERGEIDLPDAMFITRGANQ
jgi:hypothetical protein